MEWLYAIVPALKKALTFIGRSFVFIGQSIVQAVKWANSGLPQPVENGEKDKLNEHYQKLVDQLQGTVSGLGVDLQRERQRTVDLEEKMDGKIDQLEKKVEECQEDRDALRRELNVINRLIPNTGQTLPGE